MFDIPTNRMFYQQTDAEKDAIQCFGKGWTFSPSTTTVTWTKHGEGVRSFGSVLIKEKHVEPICGFHLSHKSFEGLKTCHIPRAQVFFVLFQ